jgi:hypothetical protein
MVQIYQISMWGQMLKPIKYLVKGLVTFGESIHGDNCRIKLF